MGGSDTFYLGSVDGILHSVWNGGSGYLWWGRSSAEGCTRNIVHCVVIRVSLDVSLVLEVYMEGKGIVWSLFFLYE